MLNSGWRPNSLCEFYWPFLRATNHQHDWFTAHTHNEGTCMPITLRGFTAS